MHAAFVLAHASASLSEAASLGCELSSRLKDPFVLTPLSSTRYLEGRAASILSNNIPVGQVGEIHPAVLEKNGLFVPVSAFEVRLVSGKH